MHFTQFVQNIKQTLVQEKLGTLTIDMSPTDLIKSRLVDPKEVGKIADTIVLMTYDYHFAGSLVSGPVAPLGGAGVVSEFDVQTAVEKALAVIPTEKIILGLPLYGYEWETITNMPRSAVIPTTGLTASVKRISDFIASCATCSAQHDSIDAETYLVFADSKTGTFHQIFYPDEIVVKTKLDVTKKFQLQGVALWALGYEDEKILEPLKKYK
jgi:spore germination protein